MMATGPNEYSYSAGDIVALNLAIWWYWVALVAVVPVAMIAAPLIIGFADGNRLVWGDLPWIVMSELTLFVVAWIVGWTFFAFWRRKRDGSLGPIRIKLEDGGVRVDGPRLNALLYWPAIRSIHVTADHLFLFMTRRTAVIVPRRAFRDQSGFGEFAAEVQQAWLQAKGR